MYIISGKFKKKRLTTLKDQLTRPTASRLRETCFNIWQGRIEGARFLDLFAGSGAIGLEALSRGASSATFIEKDPSAVAVIKKNISSLGVEDAVSVHSSDCITALERLLKSQKQFDLVYIDPPYDQSYLPVLEFLDCSNLLSSEAEVLVETEVPQEDRLHQLIRQSRRQQGRSWLLQYRFFV